MNYELAKELKDAGFKQKDGSYIFPDGVSVGFKPSDESADISNMDAMDKWKGITTTIVSHWR